MIGACVSLASPAAALTCRAVEGGAAFTPSEVREVPAAAVQMLGSEEGGVVYHVDRRNELGGCNRKYVAAWGKREGSPIGHRHGRLRLACQERPRDRTIRLWKN